MWWPTRCAFSSTFNCLLIVGLLMVVKFSCLRLLYPPPSRERHIRKSLAHVVGHVQWFTITTIKKKKKWLFYNSYRIKRWIELSIFFVTLYTLCLLMWRAYLVLKLMSVMSQFLACYTIIFTTGPHKKKATFRILSFSFLRPFVVRVSMIVDSNLLDIT